MASYRFCRSDDIPLLVEAYQACFGASFGVSRDEPPLDAARFKRLIHELNLWTSSCMVASADKKPIGVMLAAKRDHANLIHTIGIHPDHRRQGHGKHLMTSLSSKLAILGPRRMLAEVSHDRADLRTFIEACGYEPETAYTDYTFEPTPGPRPPAELMMPVTLQQLVDDGVFDTATPRCWARSVETLTNLENRPGGSVITGHALASESSIEAYLLTRDDEILAIGARQPERAAKLLGALLRHTASERTLSIQRVSDNEIQPGLLQALGSRPGPTTVAYTTEAESA